MKKLTKILVFTIAPILAGSGMLFAEEGENDAEQLEQLRERIEGFRAAQQARVEERRALANDEEFEGDRGEAMRALIEEQAAEQRALGQQIREMMKEREALRHRERRGPGDDERGPGLAPEDGSDDLAEKVRGLNEEFRTERDRLLAQWRERAQNTPKEERRELYRQWREERREEFEALRESRRAIREAAQERAEERRNRSNP